MKKLGLFSGVSTCVGLIVSTSCLSSLGQGMGLAGSAFVGAMAIVVVLNIFQAFSFSELYHIMPHAEGGFSQYIAIGVGRIPAIVSTLSAYVITVVLGCAVEVTMCGMVLHDNFLPQIPAPIISVFLLVILTIVNFNGVQLFAKLQNAVVALLLGSFLVMGILSFFKLSPQPTISQAAQTTPSVHGFGGILSLSSTAFWLFIGIEFVIPIAKELKNPKRNVLLSMTLSVIVLFVIQSILGTGMTNYVSLQDLCTSDLPHMIFAEKLLGKFGTYWMGIVTLLAGISTVNTGLGSIPSVLSGMAENEMAPAIFTHKNKHGIAFAGLFTVFGGVTAVVASGFAQSAGISNLILAASCFWITAYIFINLSVLVLRKRYPHAPGRDRRLTFKGIPQIVCIVANIYMIANIAEGEARLLILRLYGIILILLTIYAVIWEKIINRKTSPRPKLLSEDLQ